MRAAPYATGFAKFVGKKQTASQEEFERAYSACFDFMDRDEVNGWIDEAADFIRKEVGNKRAAYGWSGGKDSEVLRVVMDRAGIERCVLGLSRLEFREFLSWATANMPDGLTIENTGQDLAWLAEHPEMLFPRNSTIAAKWFKSVQHTAQARYFESERLDVLILGRRVADGNYTGKRGEVIYTSKGVTRYSPLANWSHEQCLGVFAHVLGKEALAPCYSWPRGYRVGTGPWPARQWTDSEAHGWSEVWEIDSAVVHEAAKLFPGAARQVELATAGA